MMDAIGTQFATERKKRGLDYNDVERAIGIRALYVQALEEGHYEVLPGEVYVKGFMRNYGNFLGLDGAGLVQAYLSAKSPIEPQAVIQHPQTKSATQQVTGNRKLIVAAMAFLILVAAGGGLYMWKKGQRDPVVRPVAVAQTEKVVAPSPTQAIPAAIPAVTVTGRAVVVTAKFTDRCWTSAIADGKTVYEGIPKIGETLSWEADRQIIVNLGNAAAADISLNGQPQGKMGERGDVVVKTFTATTSPTVNTSSNAPSQTTPNTAQPPVRP